MKKILITIVLTAVLLLPNLTLAANTGLGSALGQLQSATTDSGLEKDLSTSIGSIINVVLSLVGTIFLVLTIYAGILWMTASGKDEQVTKARDIITASIIGLFIVMGAYAITYAVTVGLGGAKPGSGGTAPSGSGPLGASGCPAKGGKCLTKSNTNACSDPKNAPSTEKDYFTGSVLGMCDTTNVCCEIDEDAGKGLEKCKVMTGICQKECGSTQKTLGKCVIPGGFNDQKCCK